MKGKLLLTLLSLAFLCHAQTLAKGLSKDAIREVDERYQKASVLVLKKEVTIPYSPGMLARSRIGSFQFPFSGQVDIEGGKITRHFSTGGAEDTTIQLEVGTLLIILSRRFDKDNRIELRCDTAKEYPVERRTVFKTETRNETIDIKFRFFFDKSILKENDLETVFRTIDSWVKPFPTEEEAMAYRNTLIIVPEIKLGMTIAEVESVFGVPLRKATLADKVFYKYEDMTVEFVDGKVSDVKF